MSRRLRRWTHKFAGESGYQRIAGDLEVQGNIIGPSISLIGTAIDKLACATTTPVVLTITRCEGQYKGIILQWSEQYNLANLSHYELQVSSDQTDWYSLKSDGTGWRGTINLDTDVEGPLFVHTPIPFDGTTEEPVAVKLYYRMRQKTIMGVVCAWSAITSATTSLVDNGDVLANTLTGNKIIAGSISAREMSFGTDALSVPVFENTDPANLTAHLFDLSQPDCVANTGILPASGREIVYAPATSIDETLKEYPHPWSPRLYGQSEAIFAARTNLVKDPEDLTTANWSAWGVSTPAPSDYFTSHGQRYTKIIAGAAWGGREGTVVFTGDGIKSYQCWLRRGSETGSSELIIYDATAPATRGLISVNWTTKVVTATTGTLIDSEWNGNDEVWIGGITTSVTAANANRIVVDTATNGASVYCTAIQAEDAAYPSPYIDKFRWPTQVRPAVSANYAVTMPGKFVFKIKVRPWFAYTSGIYHTVGRWYSAATSYFKIQWDFASDKFYIVWRDTGNERILTSSAFVADVNQELILFGAVNLDSGGIGDSRFSVFLENGTQFSEDFAWDNAPDVKSSTFSEFQLGHAAAAIHVDSQISYAKFWTWTGAALGTLNTEADIDRVTAGLTSLFSWEGEDYDVGYKPTGKQGAVGLFKATTNLVASPEDLTTVSWTNDNSTDALSDYYIDGKQFTRITATAADGQIYQRIYYTGNTVKSAQIWVKRGDDTVSTVYLWDATAATVTLGIDITWATKTVGASTGTLRDAIWISDDLVWVSGISTVITAGNVNYIYLRTITNGKYSYFTAIQIENSVYPTPYTPTTRAAGILKYPLALPRKFTAMFELRPWFNYNTANTPMFLTWYVAANNVFLIYYVPATDQITVGWIDGGVARYLHGPTLNSAALLNQNIMVAASIDLDGGQTGSMLKVYAGSTIDSDKDWGAAPDTKTSEFPTLRVGYDHLDSDGVADSFLTDLLILPGVLLTETQCDEHFNKTRPWYSQSEVASNNKQVRIDRSGIRLHNAQLNITDWRNRQILISNRDGLLARDAGGKVIHDIPETPIVTGMQYLGHLFLQSSATYFAWDGAAATSVAVSAFDDSGAVQFNLSTYLPPQFGNPHGVKILVGVLADVAANKITHATTDETLAGAAIWYSPNFAWGGHAAGGGIQGFYFQADVQAHAAATWDLVKYGIFDAPVVWDAGIPYYIYEAHSAIYNMVANNGAFEVRVLSSILGWWV